MALPASMNGIFAPNGGRHGPFASGGNYYIVTRDPTNAYEMQVEKSADPTTTAFTQSASDTVADTGKTVRSIDAVQSGTDLYILVGVDDGSVMRYSFYIFSMSSDSFTVTDENAMSTSTNIPTSTLVYGSLGVRSDGSVVALMQGAGEKIHGTPYRRVAYKKRSSGGTWDTGVTAVDDAGSVEYNYPRMVMGASDKAHFFYFDGTDIQHKSLNSSNTLSSAEAINDNAPADGKSQLAYINDGTSELIVGVWERSSNSHLVGCVVDDDTTPAAEADVSGAAISTGDFTITGDNNSDSTSRSYTLWVDNGDSDIDGETYTPGSGWSGTPYSIEATITATAIAGANVYTNDASDTVLAYLYDESTNSESYNEYGLGGALSVNLGFISSGTTLYNPTVRTELPVNLTFISSATSVYSPTVQTEQRVNLGFIASTTALYTLIAKSTIALNFISSGTVLYNPTVRTELPVSLGFIASATTLYNPTVRTELRINLTFISSGTNVYALTAQRELRVNLTFISSTTSVYALDASISLIVNLTFIASSSSIYALSAQTELRINLTFIASSTSVYTLAALSNIALNFINSTTSIYALTTQTELRINLTFIASTTNVYALAALSTIALNFINSVTNVYALTAQTELRINLTFISSGTNVYALTAQRELRVNLTFISSTTSVYALDASISLIVNLTFIASGTTLYNPTVRTELPVNLTFISSATSVYSPTVQTEQRVNLGFIASTTALYTLIAKSTIALNFISSGTVLYNPTVRTELPVSLGFIASATSVYALVASVGLSVNLTFISSTTSLYNPSVQSTIALAFIASSSSIYTLIAQTELRVLLNFISSATVLYSPTVRTELRINLTFIDSTSQVYQISVSVAVSGIIDYDSVLSDYELYQAIISEYELYDATLVDYELYIAVLAEYELYNATLANYELYTSVLEDDMPVQDGTIAKKLTLTIGDDHTGSFSEPDTISFLLEYPDSDPVEYIYGTDSEVSKHPTLAGIYFFKILASQAGDAYVQAKAVWTNEVWTEITQLQTVKIYRFIGA